MLPTHRNLLKYIYGRPFEPRTGRAFNKVYSMSKIWKDKWQCGYNNSKHANSPNNIGLTVLMEMLMHVLDGDVNKIFKITEK